MIINSSLHLLQDPMCQIYTQWSHFLRQLVTVVFDDVLIEKYGNIIMYLIINSSLHLLQHPMCQIHTQWSHFSRQLVTVVVDDILIEKVWSDHHVMINNSTLHLLSHCLSGGPRLKKNLNSNSIFFVIVLVFYFQKG